MEIHIGCSEAILSYDQVQRGSKGRKLGFVGGAIVKNAEGKVIASVSGSDEYSFRIEGVTKVQVKRKTRFHERALIITTNWTERGAT